MGEVLVSVTFPNLAEKDQGEFKKLAQEAVILAGEEAGTLQYDWFLSADQTRCVVREKYASSEAALVHLGNIGTVIGPLAKLGGGLEIDTFGDLSPGLREAFAAAAATPYSRFTGK